MERPLASLSAPHQLYFHTKKSIKEAVLAPFVIGSENEISKMLNLEIRYALL